MVYCAAFGCNAGTARGNKCSFFRFPLRNPALLKCWLINVKRDKFKPSVHSRLCSKHFERVCFEPSRDSSFQESIGVTSATKSRPILKVDAVPTLFDYTKEPKRPRKVAVKRRKKSDLLSILNTTACSSKSPDSDMKNCVDISVPSEMKEIGIGTQTPSCDMVDGFSCTNDLIKTQSRSTQSLKLYHRSKHSQTDGICLVHYDGSIHMHEEGEHNV